MENNTGQPNLKERILDKIESGKVKMRSASYFNLKTAGAVIVALAVLLLTVFICNFILFSIRIAGHNPFTHSGLSEFYLFLRLFPWPFLLFDIALMILLQELLKQFRFGYRMPVFYILLILAAVAISMGLFLDEGEHVNERLLEHAHHHELFEPLNDWYEHAPRPSESPIYLYQP